MRLFIVGIDDNLEIASALAHTYPALFSPSYNRDGGQGSAKDLQSGIGGGYAGGPPTLSIKAQAKRLGVRVGQTCVWIFFSFNDMFSVQG